MKQISFALIAALLVISAGCNRDPKAVAHGYIQKGNRYFDAGKYKEASLMYRKAIGKNKMSGDAWYRLGLTEIRLGRIAEGANALEYSISLDSANTKAHLQLGEIYLADYLRTQRDWVAAKYAAVLAKLKENTVERNRMEAAQALYIKKEFKAAIEKYRAADAVKPLDPEIVFPLAQALILDNQPGEAEKIAKATLAKEKTFEPLYGVLAGLYLRTNRFAEAESILKLQAANNPKSMGAVLALAGLYRGGRRLGEMTQVLERLASDTANFADGRLHAGRFYLQGGDYEAAIRCLEPGARSNSKSKTEYQKLIARALVAQNKKKEAIALLADVLKAKPDDVEASALNSELMIETDPVKAAEGLQKAAAKLKTDANVRYNLARALMAKRPLLLNDVEQARFNYEEALRIAPGHFQARLGLAQALLTKGDYAGAIASANEALKIGPRSTGAKLLRAVAEMQTGNLAMARADLMDVLAASPENIDAALQLAMVSLKEKKFKEADERYMKIRQAAPKDIRAVYGLVETYVLQGQHEKAIALLKTEAERTPAEQNPLLLALAKVAARANNLPLAISSLERTVAKDPKWAPGWFELGMARRAANDVKGSLESLRKARELRPGDQLVARELGISLERAGQREEARRMYEEVVKTNPDDPVALNNLAYIIAESGGDLDRALMLAQKAKQKRPEDPDVADTLGWIYIRKDLSDPAIEIFRDLVRRQPANSTFHYHLAMALYQKGDKPQAKRALQSALQHKPSKDDETKIRELMSKIG